MPKSSRLWTEEEFNLLKQLREEQKRKRPSWEDIATKLNQVFNRGKTAKQCREKYISVANSSQNDNQIKQWSNEEVLRFLELYESKGPSWVHISSKLENKSQSQIKNKFYNSLAKLSTFLETEEAKNNYQKSRMNVQILSLVMDFLNKIHKVVVQDLSLTKNPQSRFFRIRSEIINVCFNEEFRQAQSPEFYRDFLQRFKHLSAKVRGFGVFKVKNIRRWKVSSKNLRAICTYDKLFLQDQADVFQQMSEATNNESQDNQSKTQQQQQQVQKQYNNNLINHNSYKSQCEQNSKLNQFGDAFILQDQYNDADQLDEKIYEILGFNDMNQQSKLI